MLLSAATSELHLALEADAIRAILLKGPAVATWLYGDGELRPYGDIDLLVSPADVPKVEDMLAAQGFALHRPGLSPLEETGHGRAWVRKMVTVDLHWTLWGVGVGPEQAWKVLSAATDRLPVDRSHVEMLNAPARALHVALHAAQHGWLERKPIEDLERAATRVPFETWQAAAVLARRLKADGAMAAGLRLCPGTETLPQRLGLPRKTPWAVRLHAGGATGGVLGLARVLGAGGVRSKAVMVARRLVPTPARMRARYPSSRLVVAHLRRYAELLAGVPPALANLWRARRNRAR